MINALAYITAVSITTINNYNAEPMVEMSDWEQSSLLSQRVI